MEWFKWIEIGFLILLSWIVLVLTLPFEERYDETLSQYAEEPLFRIIVGVLLVTTAQHSMPISLLLFVMAFFWITDVHLVSNIKM